MAYVIYGQPTRKALAKRQRGDRITSAQRKRLERDLADLEQQVERLKEAMEKR